MLLINVEQVRIDPNLALSLGCGRTASNLVQMIGRSDMINDVLVILLTTAFVACVVMVDHIQFVSFLRGVTTVIH